MKIKTISIVFLLLTTLLSCKHTQIIQLENLPDGRSMRIETSPLKYKGEKFKQLSSIIKDNDDKIICSYYITTKCGCIGKTEHVPRITRYRLTTSNNFDLPLNETDKLVFKKLASLSEIETYCSKNLLDSAKGFIKNK